MTQDQQSTPEINSHANVRLPKSEQEALQKSVEEGISAAIQAGEIPGALSNFAIKVSPSGVTVKAHRVRRFDVAQGDFDGYWAVHGPEISAIEIALRNRGIDGVCVLGAAHE